MSDHETGNCLNCGTTLVGDYCHACGQSAHVHRSMGAFMHDLLHGALHFEGKIWRTLPLLVFRPGKLTRRYIDGARARFVSPMALFLFVVFLMFAVFQIVGLTAPASVDPPSFGNTAFDLQEQAEAQLTELQSQANALPQSDEERVSLEQQIADARATLSQIENLAPTQADDDTGTITTDGLANTVFGNWIENTLVKKWGENPGLMIYKLQSNGYKFSWLLIPLSIPFVWVLFAWRLRFNTYDHAVFVTYSLSFMTLLFVVLSVLGRIGVHETILIGAGAIIPPMHIYKQLRGTYELSRFGALVRLLILSLMIWVVAALFVWAMLMLGAM